MPTMNIRKNNLCIGVEIHNLYRIKFIVKYVYFYYDPCVDNLLIDLKL